MLDILKLFYYRTINKNLNLIKDAGISIELFIPKI